MRTKKLIHRTNPTKTLWSCPAGLLAPRTTEQIMDEVTACGLMERKTDPYRSRSTLLGPFRQPCVRRLALSQHAPHRWGVVLAGGDGERLRELTRWMYGEDRPKQFCQLLGNRTLLEEARQRAERSFPKEQILFSLTRAHENHYLRYFGGPAIAAHRSAAQQRHGSCNSLHADAHRSGGPGCGCVNSSLRSLLFLRERVYCGLRVGSGDRGTADGLGCPSGRRAKPGGDRVWLDRGRGNYWRSFRPVSSGGIQGEAGAGSRSSLA